MKSEERGRTGNVKRHQTEEAPVPVIKSYISLMYQGLQNIASHHTRQNKRRGKPRQRHTSWVL